MVERFVRWLCGYLYIQLKGGEALRFINLCNGNEMYLWKIKKDEDGISCYIRLKHYKKLKNAARKCKVIPFIRKRIGFPFLLYKIKKRKILFCSAVLFLSFIYILSLFIWNIGFEGNHLHTDEKLREFLKEMSVDIGSRKKEIDCPQIEAQLRKHYPDIGWASVELKGTKLYVRIEETTVPEPPERKAPAHLTEADIAAEKEGIIKAILVRSGTAKVKAGDVVRKGDILVSGLVPVIGDSGEAVSIKRMIPDADIIMKTVENYNDIFLLAYDKKNYTGIEKSGYDVIVFGNNIFSYSPSNSYSEYDIIRDVVHLKAGRDFYLPFLYQKTTYKEYYIEQRIYTEEEAVKAAVKNLERRLNDLREQGIQVESIDTKTEIQNGKCVTSGKLMLLEPAYQYIGIKRN